MTIAESERRSPGTLTLARDPRKHPASVVRRVSGAIEFARRSATMHIVRPARSASAPGSTSPGRRARTVTWFRARAVVAR